MRSIAVLFQSTHPVWGATSILPDWASPSRYFNPRTPCGVRPPMVMCWSRLVEFQSTHPVWGATRGPPKGSESGIQFQSTHPVWGAT